MANKKNEGKTVQASAQQPMPQNVATLFKAAGVQVGSGDLSADECMQEGLKRQQRSALEAIAAGMYFFKARDIEGHGYITSQATKLGISARTITRHIDAYQLLLKIPNSKVDMLSSLGVTKLTLLNRLDNEELEALTSGDEVRGITLDDALVFPSREIDRRLKEAEISNNELQQQVEKERGEKELAQRENTLLKRQKNEPLGFIYPSSIEQVRIESSALANQIVQCLDDMQQLIVVLNSATDLDSEDPNKSDAEYSAGASALAVNLTATYSKASFLLSNFKSMVGGGFIPEQPEDTPLLTEEEAQRVFNMREYMLAEHEIEKSARNSARSKRRK